MPVRLWGVDPMFPRQDWGDLYRLTETYELEIIRTWTPEQEEWPRPGYEKQVSESISDKSGIKEIRTTLVTPSGPITSIYYQPLDGSPGYVKKHFIETVQDAKRWLSIPGIEKMPEVDSYRKLEEKSGERAMLMVALSEAMYSVQSLMGSETFGYWLYDERQMLLEMIEKAFRDIEKIVKHYLFNNLGDAYGWVGPELCIPPLASVRDFRELVFFYDKKVIDLIHEKGKLAWIHCHGDISTVLKDFIEMGLDCLNPVEGPPVGKYTLKQVKEICGKKMALDGGIEDGVFDRCTPEETRTITRQVISEGKPGGCFILCPTSSPDTRARLSTRNIENYAAFVETAAELRNY